MISIRLVKNKNRIQLKTKVLQKHVLQDAIETVQRKSVGRPTHHNTDEEALIVASAEVKATHGLP